MKINDLAIHIKVINSLGEVLYKRDAKLEDKEKIDKIFFDIKQKFDIENNLENMWREQTKILRDGDNDFSKKMKEHLN
jgi:hypothetical protein